MGPLPLIAVSAVIGFLVGGLGGAGLGALLGFILSFVVSAAVRLVQGGALPRKVRRTLAANLIRHHPEVVASALPGLQGDLLHKRLEEIIESIGTHAVHHAPSPGTVWTETAVTLGIKDMIDDTPSREMKELYGSLLDRVWTDWYEVSYLRGIVEPAAPTSTAPSRSPPTVWRPIRVTLDFLDGTYSAWSSGMHWGDYAWPCFGEAEVRRLRADLESKGIKVRYDTTLDSFFIRDPR